MELRDVAITYRVYLHLMEYALFVQRSDVLEISRKPIQAFGQNDVDRAKP
jgi:hypothetical protein